MSKMTPGPWKIKEIKDERGRMRTKYFIVGADLMQITGGMLNEADAKAIARVPDMIALIQTVYEELQHDGRDEAIDLMDDIEELLADVEENE